MVLKFSFWKLIAIVTEVMSQLYSELRRHKNFNAGNETNFFMTGKDIFLCFMSL